MAAETLVSLVAEEDRLEYAQKGRKMGDNIVPRSNEFPGRRKKLLKEVDRYGKIEAGAKMGQRTKNRIKRLESATDVLVGTILDYLKLDVQIIELHKKVAGKKDVDVKLIHRLMVRRLELNAHATGVLQRYQVRPDDCWSSASTMNINQIQIQSSVQGGRVPQYRDSRVPHPESVWVPTDACLSALHTQGVKNCCAMDCCRVRAV